MKELSLTPLMTISLTLTIGIIIAKWGYDDFNMRFWLIISIISCALGSIIFFLTEFLSQKPYFSRSHQFLIFSQCVMMDVISFIVSILCNVFRAVLAYLAYKKK